MSSLISRAGPSRTGALFMIVAVSLLIMLPALIDARMMSGDTAIHVRWQAYFARAFWSDGPYPRWLADLNEGFGSPAFFIYPPMEQWLGALFAPLWPGDALAARRMFAALVLCLIVGGVGVRAWLRALPLRRSAALFGALTYLLLPYHAYFNAYQRGALAELVGMAALPWGLCFAHRLKRGAPFAWAGFALSLAALFYSHAPTSLFAVPFTGLYALLLADRGDALRLGSRVALSGALGVAIAAAYLGPALTQVGAINAATLFDGVYQARNYLLFASAPWPDRGIQLVVTALFALHLVLFLLSAIALRRHADAWRPPAAIMLVAMLTIFLSMTALARPFWDPALPWSKIQFAWRMMSLQTLMLAGLAGILWQTRETMAWRRGLAALLPALLLIDVGLFVARIWHADRPAGLPVEQRGDFRLDVAEYRLGSIERLGAMFGGHRAILIGGSGHVAAIDWRARHIMLAVQAVTPTRVAVRQFAYTGWATRIDGGDWVAARRIGAPCFTVAVDVPAGSHRVEMRLAPTRAESFGSATSLVALALCAIGLAAEAGRRRRLARRDLPTIFG